MAKRLFILLFIINIAIINISAQSNVFTLYQEGQSAVFAEDYVLAIEKFKQALEINPNYIEPILQLAKIYYETGNYDYAYDYMQRALKLSDKKPELQVFAADIESKLGRYESAEKRYRQVLAKNPLNTDAHNGLAQLYLDTNRHKLAQNALLDIIKTDNKNYRAISMLAQFYEKTDLNAARNYYIMNIEKNSLNPDSFLDYSVFCYNHGDMIKALDYIKTAMSLSNKPKYKKYYGKYLLCLNKGDEALSVFKDILRSESSPIQGSHISYISYYHLAMAYCLTSDYDNAVTALDKALSLRDDDETSMYCLNDILITEYSTDNKLRSNMSQKFYEKALAAKKESAFDLYINFLRESLRLYPKNVEARIELAEYFKSVKYYERYINELEIAAKYTDDKNIHDRLEIEKQTQGYKLGDTWEINQYEIKNDTLMIPLFINDEINNEHYNLGKIYANLLEHVSYDKVKFELEAFDEESYSDSDKITLALKNKSPFYTELHIAEGLSNIDVTISLYNAVNKEKIRDYHTSHFGNNRLITSVSNILAKINEDIPFRAHIVKISGSKALINAGKRSGLKPKTKLIILQNGEYPAELTRSRFLYNTDNILGTAKVKKVDENVSEIELKDNDYFKQINLDDILIY